MCFRNWLYSVTKSSKQTHQCLVCYVSTDDQEENETSANTSQRIHKRKPKTTTGNHKCGHLFHGTTTVTVPISEK